MRVPSLIVCLCLVVCLAAGSIRAQSVGVIADRESYAVFAAMLSLESWSSRPVPSRIALLEETRSATNCFNDESVPPEWRPVLANYREKNAHTWTLRADADLGRQYALVSMLELRQLMRNVGYDLSRLKGE